jgi:hypothetical protein
MAELSTLQEVGILAGIAGFGISLVNAVQTWMRNRPLMSAHPGLHPADDEIEITIENPSSRALTIRRIDCWPRGAQQLCPENDDLRRAARREDENDVNVVILPRASCRFSFFRAPNKGGFLLLVHWHNNAALLFSRVPLFLMMTKRRREALRRAGIAR